MKDIFLSSIKREHNYTTTLNFFLIQRKATAFSAAIYI